MRIHNPIQTSLRRTGARGFTLVELMLVLVILGVLAAIVVPKFGGITANARKKQAITQISSFGTALDNFEVDVGHYPKGNNGLQDLSAEPRDSQGWKGPYMKDQIPLDPWQHPYLYESPGRHNPTGYDLSSAGEDGKEGTEDDICSWSLSSASK